MIPLMLCKSYLVQISVDGGGGKDPDGSALDLQMFTPGVEMQMRDEKSHNRISGKHLEWVQQGAEHAPWRCSGVEGEGE